MPPPTNDTPRRKNGFSRPFSGAQVSTWIAWPLLLAEFIIIVAPVLPLEASIPCTVVYCVTAILAAYYAYVAQKIDPLDEYLEKHLRRKETGEQAADNGFGGALGSVGDENEPLKHCWICETQVAEHSMHCKFCNKCTSNFDHHCMWLNTCIGKKNYKYFLLTMAYITAMLLVHFSIQLALVIDIFLDGTSKERANEWFETDLSEVIVGIMIGFVVFDGIALSLILQLLYFHMQLRREGLTTYKFIVRETQRKREKANLEQARKTQRMIAMGKANDDKKFFLALRLRYGEFCSCCDPLPPLEEEKKNDGVPQNNNGASGLTPPQVESLDDQPPENGGVSNGHHTNRDIENGNEVEFVAVANA